jgi:hypothetical protein
MRTEDIEFVADEMERCGFWAIEVWGGATFDVPHRFLGEDPWERPRVLKKLMPKTKFMMRQEQMNEIRVFDLAAFEGLTLDSGRVNGWVQAFKSGFAIIAYPFAVAGSYLYRIVQALIYALIALIFARVLKVSLEYGALLQLALVAITPVLLLNTLRTVLGVPVPFAGLISFLVALGYLFLAVKANAGNGSASA